MYVSVTSYMGPIIGMSINQHGAAWYEVPDKGFFKQSGLVARNISIQGRRSTIRLDDLTWSVIKEVARREGITPNQLYARIWRVKPKKLNFTVAVRQYLMLYFRAAATEEGHAEAGHGSNTAPCSALSAKAA
jgi:predicted DNA-binding ribbon-helix-helix protein